MTLEETTEKYMRMAAAIEDAIVATGDKDNVEVVIASLGTILGGLVVSAHDPSQCLTDCLSALRSVAEDAISIGMFDPH